MDGRDEQSDHRCASMPRNACITRRSNGRCVMSVYASDHFENDRRSSFITSASVNQRIFFCPFCGQELQSEEAAR